jgi:membrane-associated protease RseP (regulator of RpoE activity)
VSSIDGWTIALVLLVAYAVAVFALYRRGWIGRDRSLSLFGPALMIKTRRGRGLLDRLGRFRRFWSVAGDVGILLAALAMVTIVFVLILDAIVALSIPASAAPSPQEALGIPGINPIIPIGYGLVALVVGVVLHELLHGVIARSQQIGVKSLGILWFVVPIGAFVEQDDEEMSRAPRRRRDRVAAAGVLANFALTVLFFVALSALLTTSVQSNATGVGVAGVLANTPAANASLAAGDIITQVNGTPTPNNLALYDALALTHPNQTVAITYYSASAGHLVNTTITLTSLAVYTNQSADASRGFLGVSLLYLTPAQLKDDMASPLTASQGPLAGATYWIVLPLAGLQPVGGPVQSFYHLSGPLAGMDPGTFWIVANLLYWLAWMNLLLGLSNALPLFPLDGGLLFRDFSSTLAARLRKGWDEARVERFGNRAATAASLLVLFLLLWQFVAPRL